MTKPTPCGNWLEWNRVAFRSAKGRFRGAKADEVSKWAWNSSKTRLATKRRKKRKKEQTGHMPLVFLRLLRLFAAKRLHFDTESAISKGASEGDASLGVRGSSPSLARFEVALFDP